MADLLFLPTLGLLIWFLAGFYEPSGAAKDAARAICTNVPRPELQCVVFHITARVHHASRLHIQMSFFTSELLREEVQNRGATSRSEIE